MGGTEDDSERFLGGESAKKSPKGWKAGNRKAESWRLNLGRNHQKQILYVISSQLSRKVHN